MTALLVAWHERKQGHKITFRKVTAPAFDPSAKGHLWTCSCGKVWAR